MWKIDEITYIQKYSNIFNKSVSICVNSNIIETEIEDHFNEMILKLIKNDRFRDAKVNFLEAKRHEDLEAVERLKA